MKTPTLIVSIIFSIATAVSCQQRKTTEINTPATQIMTADSPAIVASTDSIDSTSLDPEVQETALQQDPPPARSTSRTDCELAFILLSKPAPNHHIFQVNGFDAGNFRCWAQLEEHGKKLCGENSPCEISYLEVSEISKTKPPHYVDAAILKKYGIGHFTYKNAWWELNGARIWGRSGKDFEFYNSNRY